MASAPPSTTPAEAAAAFLGYVANLNADRAAYANWCAGAANGGPSGDGKYPLTDFTGNVHLVPCPAAMVAQTAQLGPLSFGAIGDGASHPASTKFATLAACQAVYPKATSLNQEMDFLAWQKMVDTTGNYKSDQRTYKMSNAALDSQTPLVWVAGVSDVDAGMSTLDWTATTSKVNTLHYIPDPNFNTPADWVNSTAYPNGGHDNATFGNGKALCPDLHDGTIAGLGPYYEFSSVPETLPPGRYRMLVAGTIKRGVSYDHGNFNPPYASCEFRGNDPTTGANIYFHSASVPLSLDPTNPATTYVPFSTQLDFETSVTTSGFVTWHDGGYADIILTAIDIVPWPSDYGILNTRDGAPQHYFTPRRLRNATLVGPGGNSGVFAACWKSFTDQDGDLHEWDNVEASGWYGAVDLSDGAYLLSFYNVRLIGNGPGGCVRFLPGSNNAGENNRFYGGTIANSAVAINNPGAGEFTFFGTAIDYNTQAVINNNGKVRFVGIRHEQYAPTPNTPVPIWHCTSGRVLYDSCFVLLAGTPLQAPVAPAQLDQSVSSIEFNGTEVYNFSSLLGYAATGAGRVSFNGFLNSGNPNLGPALITQAPNQDVLGGAGLFEPISAQYQTDPTGIFLQGGIFPGGGAVMTDRWTSDQIACSVSTDYARTGTRSMKVTRLKPFDNTVGSQVHLLVPLPAIGNFLGQINFLFPQNLGANTQNPEIYYRTWWVQVIGQDQYGRPRYGPKSVFKGEQDLIVPVAGTTQWVGRGVGTAFEIASSDPSQDLGDRSPAWATHELILLDCQSIPAMSFYIDDFQANFLG